MGKRILFHFNEVAAKTIIEKVTKTYVARVSSVASEICNLNIGVPSRAMLYDAIYNGGDMVYKALLGKAQIPDDDILANIIMDKIAANIATISSLANEIVLSTETIYNGMPISNPSLFDWIAIDGNGVVSLDEKRAEIIRDECREYITTETGIKLHNLQTTIIESLQEIYDVLFGLTQDPNAELHPTARFAFFHPGALWLVQDDEQGRTKFIPRSINFDPQPKDDIISLD